jgi:Ion channel/Pentapeptide repeats (8 copies)
MNSPHKEIDFWLDEKQTQQDPLIKQHLQEWAYSQKPMHDFCLREANLNDINLVNRGHDTGYDMQGTDLDHAKLQNAHLFKINLENASLMKADLTGANLHCANLNNCNLLGANLLGAKVDNIFWGKELIQEKKAREAAKNKNYPLMIDFYEQAEEIYRHLRLVSEASGMFENAGNFFYKEMVMRRRQMKRWGFKRGISKMVDVFCGYGEDPIRVVLFSLGVILFCALLFFILGINDNGIAVGLHRQSSLTDNIRSLFSCIYFSVVTFTTLGYGDLTPSGSSRALAAIEAFAGSFTIALFVVVFVKKMTR